METFPLYAIDPKKIQTLQNSGNLEISKEFLYTFETLQNLETPTKAQFDTTYTSINLCLPFLKFN